MAMVDEDVPREERRLQEHFEQLLQDAARQVGERVVQPVVVPLTDASDQQLDADEQEEDGDREDDVIHARIATRWSYLE